MTATERRREIRLRKYALRLTEDCGDGSSSSEDDVIRYVEHKVASGMGPENAQSVLGFLDMLQGQAPGVLNAAGADHKVSGLKKMVSGDLVRAENLTQSGRGCGIAVLQGVYERQRHLAFLNVISHRLPQFLEVARVVQRVIDELKGDAEVMAVIPQSLHMSGGTGGEKPADLTGRADEHRRFAGDHLKVFLLVNLQIVGVDQLKHFPFGHLGGGFGKHFQDAELVMADRQENGFGIKKIADEDDGGIPPYGIGRRLAATILGVVHDIVVEQAAGPRDDALDDCIRRVVSGWAFPPPEEEATVRTTLLL